jgi:hypothetical protein
MKTTEYSNTLTNVDQPTNESYSNYEFTNIENSPFTIVRQENKYYGVIGNHRLTEEYSNLEELREDLLKITWDRLTQVIWAVVEKFKVDNEQIKELLKEK